MNRNLAVVGNALQIVASALEPFVRRVVVEETGFDGEWTDLLREKDERAGYTNPVYREGDLVPLLRVLTERLGAHGYPFSRVMPQISGTYANELRSVRNLWAHLQSFTDADTFRALDTSERLLRTAGLFDAADRISLERDAAFDRLVVARKVPAPDVPEELTDYADAPVPAEDHRDQVPVDSMASRIAQQDEATGESDLAEALRQLLAELDRPIPMAALSQKLIGVFGVGAVEGWSAVGGFGAFIAQAEPRAALSGPLPGYVHPPGRAVPVGWEREDHEAELPEAIRALRSADGDLPLVTWPRMRDTIRFAISGEPPLTLSGALSRSEVERRSVHAIAEAARSGHLIYRAHVSWVLKALQREHPKEVVVSMQSAVAAVATYLVSLAPVVGVSPEVLHADIRVWLRSHSD